VKTGKISFHNDAVDVFRSLETALSSIVEILVRLETKIDWLVDEAPEDQVFKCTDDGRPITKLFSPKEGS
jgi:hypothetical protein